MIYRFPPNTDKDICNDDTEPSVKPQEAFSEIYLIHSLLENLPSASNESRYSRMDQVKFVEDSLLKTFKKLFLQIF